MDCPITIGTSSSITFADEPLCGSKDLNLIIEKDLRKLANMLRNA